MPRDLPADFLNSAAQKSVKPYHILEVRYFDDDVVGDYRTVYYYDRDPTSFTASGTRGPTSSTSSAYVVDWGSVHLTLKEDQIGSVDQVSIKIEDRDGTLRDELSGFVQQRELVTIWRMFDDDSVTWPGDAGKIFTGVIQPWTWEESTNTVSIPLVDISRRFLRTIGMSAKKTIFTDISEENADQIIPLCIGRAHQVKAVLIKSPWQTKLQSPMPKGATGSMTMDIQDHPNEIGAGTGGTSMAVSVGSDRYTGLLSLSSSPDTVHSTVTLSNTGISSPSASGTIGYVFEHGAAKYGVIEKSSISPPSAQNSFATSFPPGTVVDVNINGTWYSDGIATIENNQPYEGYIKVTLETHNSSLEPGSIIRAGSGSQQKAWPAGTIVSPYSGDWVYAVNALPSKEIIRVEGFGGLIDQSGNQNTKDFVFLGGKASDTTSGTVNLTNQTVDPYEVNLADDTWLTELGHKITTITFKTAPKNLEPSLESNDIWVTLDGIETTRGDGGRIGGSTGDLITNPAAVIGEIIEHPALCNIDESYVDSDSFDESATVLDGVYCGFAVTESKDALELLQDIARQCRCYLFFDQGKIGMKVLHNTTPGHTLEYHQGRILQQTLQFEEMNVDDLASEIECEWQRSWNGKGIKDKYKARAVHPTNLLNFGLNERKFESWIYHRKEHVSTQLSFLIDRWGDFRRTVHFSTSWHSTLKLQPGDWIKLTYLKDPNGDIPSATQITFTLGANTNYWLNRTDLYRGSKGATWVTSPSRSFTSQDLNANITIYPGGPWTGSSWTLPENFKILEVSEGQARVSRLGGGTFTFDATTPTKWDSPSTDLQVVGTNKVRSSWWRFQPEQVGDRLAIYATSPAGWNYGNFTITAVDDGDATLSPISGQVLPGVTSPGAVGLTGGHWYHLDGPWLPEWVEVDTPFFAIMSSNEDSDEYTFAASDIGRYLQVYAGVSWNLGAYQIKSIGRVWHLGRSRSVAFIASAAKNSSTLGQVLTGGSVYIGSEPIFDRTDCEVLEVKDSGPSGIFDIVCRHSQPYTSVTI